MNTKIAGDRCEAQVLAALVKHGKKVLIPFGEDFRYDLAVDDAGEFLRVQCKSGVYRNGVVIFNGHSTHHHRNGGPRPYHGEADYFGVYCHDLDKTYLIPVDRVNSGKPYLRVDPQKRASGPAPLMAAQFEI